MTLFPRGRGFIIARKTIYFFACTNEGNESDDDQAEQEPTIMLPLERYAKNKQKAADDTQCLLKTKTGTRKL